MTVWEDGWRRPPPRGIHEYDSSLGESLSATASEAVSEFPSKRVFDIGELSAAGSDPYLPGQEDMPGYTPVTKPDVSSLEARAKIREQGLEGHIDLGDVDTIKAPQLDIMISRAKARREREATMARGPSGFIPSALSVGTSFLVSAVDPLNLATAFIPVIPEVQAAKMLAKAGTGFAARAAARAQEGAAAGVVGMVPLVGLEAVASRQEGQDYSMARALRELMFGAALGATLHVGAGAVGDIVRTRRQTPLYPFAPGESHFAEIPGVGTHVPAEVLHEDGVSAEVIHATAPEEHSPVMARLDNLPPEAKHDAMQGSIANLISGEPVSAGEMLAHGAKTDPRIADAIEAYHGSPHDFERFEMSKIGTGEGAQVYGHGLYLAENERVARNYQKSTSYADFIRKVQELYSEHDDPTDAAELIKESKEFTPGQKELLQALEQDDWFGFDYPHQAVAAALRDNPKNWDPSERTLKAIQQVGNVYKVRITADREHFLDWDKPLNEQSAFVQERLGELIAKSDEKAWFEHRGKNVSGEEIYDALGRDIATGKTDQAQVSAMLHEAGIRGVKYLDAGSRNAGGWHITHPDQTTSGKWMVKSNDYNSKGLHFDTEAEAKAALEEKIAGETRNFVVFDDKHIEITHKNGEPIKRQDIPKPEESRAVDMTPRRRAAQDERSMSLLQFLASRGGLHPTDRTTETSVGGGLTGELKSIFDSNPFVPGYGRLLRKTGMTLDRALETAIEGGYIIDTGAEHGRVNTATINDLLQLLEKEAAGERQYRFGEGPARPAMKQDAGQREHEIEGAIDHAFEQDNVPAPTGKLRARVIEILDKEGISDPLQAYERAVMEEHYGGRNEGEELPGIPENIPGWDVPHDAGPAPGGRGGIAPEQRAEGGGAGPASRGAGARDSTSAGRRSAADVAALERQGWNEIAARRAIDDGDLLESSRRAEKLPDPVAANTEPTKRVAAAEKALAAADAEYRASEAYLPEDLKVKVEQDVHDIDVEVADRTEVLQRGAACLAAAVGDVA